MSYSEASDILSNNASK